MIYWSNRFNGDKFKSADLHIKDSSLKGKLLNPETEHRRFNFDYFPPTFWKIRS